jgi:hypothetical protein
MVRYVIVLEITTLHIIKLGLMRFSQDHLTAKLLCSLQSHQELHHHL